MQVCNQQEFDLFNQKCRHSSLSMGQEMKRIDSSSLKNEKTFQMSILKVDTPFIMLWYLKCNAEIKTNYLINQNATNWSLKGAMKFPLNELQWATITSIFLVTQFDWLKSYIFHRRSVSFSHEAWHSNVLITTYHIGRVILFSIKLNCHIG